MLEKETVVLPFQCVVLLVESAMKGRVVMRIGVWVTLKGRKDRETSVWLEGRIFHINYTGTVYNLQLQISNITSHQMTISSSFLSPAKSGSEMWFILPMSMLNFERECRRQSSVPTQKSSRARGRVRMMPFRARI